MKCLMLFVLLLVSSAASASDAHVDGYGTARRDLENFTNELSSLRLDFTQVVKSQDGSIQDETLGQAWLQSPNHMRWVYTGDFPETIVADGHNVWLYDEALQQVTVKPQSAQISDAPLLILTDMSQLEQQFTVTELGDFDNLHLLELKSRDPESEFERVLMGLDASGIKMMVMEDAFGQRTEIHFSHVLKNPTLGAGLFEFTPPEGADVVGEPGS